MIYLRFNLSLGTNPRQNGESPPIRKGGRVPGSKQYHKPTLYDLVAQYRPISSVMWDLVASQYRSKTGELKVRDGVKRYFVQKCCNNNKKPTGQSAPDPFTDKCQTLWRSILSSEEASDMEVSDEEDDEDPGLSLGQPSNTFLSPTQLDDTQLDPDYRPSFDDISETSDSEAEVIIRLESTPSQSSTMRSPALKRSIPIDNNKSKNIKHSVNQGK
jgi:hypothetical protein